MPDTLPSPSLDSIADVVTFFDVDNTLLDNDRVAADLSRFLERELGGDRQRRYWSIFERLRSVLGYADYLGALQRYREEFPTDPRVLCVSEYLVDYPFANRLFPESLDAVEHARAWGPVAILSDGDAVFQPRKVSRSGLGDAVAGNTLIYIHKERMLDDVRRRFPARHYVLVDDKLRILDAVKQAWGDGVTTVFPRQGHYARDSEALRQYPPADLDIARIGLLLDYGIDDLKEAARRR